MPLLSNVLLVILKHCEKSLLAVSAETDDDVVDDRSKKCEDLNYWPAAGSTQ